MSSTHKKYLDLLFSEARESEPVAGARIAACIVFKKTLVVIGTNQNRTDPLAQRFAKNPEADTIHAEVQAIKNTINHFRGDYEMLNGATMYICRAKRSGIGGDWIWGLAKPCDGCMKAIDFFGIKKVIYSEEGIGKFNIYNT